MNIAASLGVAMTFALRFIHVFLKTGALDECLGCEPRTHAPPNFSTPRTGETLRWIAMHLIFYSSIKTKARFLLEEDNLI
jgi:hypothetical protein